MDRTEKIDQVINNYRAERFAERKEEIKEYYKANKNEICREFTRKVRRGIQSCQKEQKAVKNIILSVLYSSSLTKSYELQIAFCDERMFFDDTPVYEYWTPAFIFEHVENDITDFKRKAAAKIPRIKEYELDDVRSTYLWNHYFMVMLLLRELVPMAVEEVYGECNMPDADVVVSFGRYMEKSIPLYQRGKTDEIFSSGNR